MVTPLDGPVAIVGLACRLPGAPDAAALFRNLLAGRSSVREIPEKRWDSRAIYSPIAGEPGATISRWGGLLDDVDRFDHRFFGITAREARAMDPQQRLLLEEAWHCLEDAAITPEELAHSSVGVFAGVMAIDYHQNATAPGVRPDAFSCLGSYGGILANRISHVFGLRGPSYTIDAACASSLVALHQARRALLAGECEYALVAAASLILNPWKYISFSQARMLSPDGLCRTFDARANGYVPGEGAVVLLLERTSAALAAGHRVHGQLLGAAINHVGPSQTITAPSVASQEALLRAAYASARVDVATVSCVEAHGTGTSLGDPIEVEALRRVFQVNARPPRSCWIGSIKTNIGHLEAAAGLAGVVKVLLMMRHRTVVPTCNLEIENPLIGFADTPFAPVRDAAHWEGRPLRAGVSSFGFGGANAHVVLEEPPEAVPPPEPSDRTEILLLSAKTRSSLEALLDAWRRFVATPEFAALSLQDIANTLACGRTHQPFRWAAVARDKADLNGIWAGARASAAPRAPTGAGEWSLVLGEADAPDVRAWEALVGSFSELGRAQAALGEPLGKAVALGGRWAALGALCAVGRAVVDLASCPPLLAGAGEGALAALVLAGVLTPEEALASLEGRPPTRLCRPSCALWDPVGRAVLHPLRVDAQVLAELGEGLLGGGEPELGRLLEMSRRLAEHQWTFKGYLDRWDQALAGVLNLREALHSPPEGARERCLVRLALTVSVRWLQEKWQLSSDPLTLDEGWEDAVGLMLDAVLLPEEAPALLRLGALGLPDLAARLGGRLNKLSPSRRWQTLRRHQTLAEVGDPGAWVAALLAAPAVEALPPTEPRAVIGRLPALPASGLELFLGALSPERLQAWLAALWEAGVDLDWAARAPRFVRCALPVTIFEGERAWIPLSGELAAAAPLRREETWEPDGIAADHLIAGRALAPAAWMLERIARLGTPPPERVRLGDIVIHRPLEMSSRQDVCVEQDREGGRLTLRGAAGELCAAKLLPRAPVPAPLSLAALKARVRGRSSQVYPRLRARGYDYGPRLAVIAEHGWGDGLDVLHLRVEAAGEDPPLAPWVDGMLQAALIAAARRLPGPAAGTWILPCAIERLEQFAALPEEAWAVVDDDGLTALPEGGVRSSIHLVDGAGDVVLRIQRCLFRPASVASPPEEGLIFRAVWARDEVRGEPAGRAPGPLLILADRGRVGWDLACRAGVPCALLCPPGWTPPPGDRPPELTWSVLDRQEPRAIARALENLPAPETVTLLWGLDLARDALDSAVVLRAEQEVILPALELFQALGRAQDRPTLALVVTRGMGGVYPGEPVGNPLQACLVGLAKSAACELPALEVRTVDLSVGAVDCLDALAEELRARPGSSGPLHEVALRPHQRFVRQLRAVAAGAAPAGAPDLRPRGVYLVVGGLGGLGMAAGRWLAHQARARLVMVGRSAAGPEQERALASLREAGAEAIYLQGDVTDLVAMQRVRSEIRARWGAVDGIVCSALVLSDHALPNMMPERFLAALRPRVLGSAVLDEVFGEEAATLRLCFSSALSLQGNAGQTNYTAGCAFQEAHARWRRERGGNDRVICWGPWAERGRVAGEHYRGLLARQGLIGLSDEEGLGALAACLQQPWPTLVAARYDRSLQRALYGEATPEAEVDPRGAAARQVLARGEGQEGASPRLREEDLDLLDEYGRALTLATWQRVGLFERSGQAYPIADLLGRMAPLPRYRRLFEASLAMLARGGYLRLERDRAVAVQVESTTAQLGRIQRALDPLRDAWAGVIRLLETCVARWPEVLAGELPATDLLFPGGAMSLVEGFYQGNPLADAHNALVAKTVAAWAAVSPAGAPLRVLELGAGTGATTRAVLDGLTAAGQRVVYTYTDVSSAFVAHGRRSFDAVYPDMRFGRLDLEGTRACDPVAEGPFDLALAANVLHATAELDAALERTAERLAPGGLLILSELTRPRDLLTLTFGLLDGWWCFRDARLPHGPLLGPDDWTTRLSSAGFADVQAFGITGRAPEERSQHILVARRSPRAQTARPAAQVASPAVPADTRPPSRIEVSPMPSPRPVSLELDTVQRVLQRCLAEALAVAEEQVPLDQRFSDLGVDSILSAEVVRRFERALGASLPPTILYEFSTPRALAVHLARPGAPVSDGAAAAAQPSAPVAVQAFTPRPIAPRAAEPPPAELSTAKPRPAPGPAAREGMVAIIGMSGRFSGAPDLLAFQDLLEAGRSAISPLPRGRFRPDALGASNEALPEGMRVGGFLEDAESFDPLFFGISPREALLMDPQQRLFLQEAWHALEDAGLAGARRKGLQVGVFAGASPGEYDEVLRHAAVAVDGQSLIAQLPSSLAARVAYCLDCEGPALTVDTACASALSALHLACDSLARGDCDLALAGGVSVLSTPTMLLRSWRAGILSPRGQCRAFDADADGMVLGEGVGVVVLKPLAAALRDGDRVYAALRAIGTRQAGAGTNGLSAPSAAAQTRLQREILGRAGVHPADVDVIEGHGTGTRLGDAIELTALARTFGARAGAAPLPLGSVKPTLGHTLCAAGMASLFKLILQLRAGLLFPTLHHANPAAEAELREAGLQVNVRLRPWPRRDGRPLLAALNAFSLNGTNAFAVLEGVPAAEDAAPSRGLHLLLLSAANVEALGRRAAALLRWVDHQGGPTDLAALARSVGDEPPRPARAALIAEDTASLRRSLAALAESPRRAAVPDLRVGVADGAADEATGEIFRAIGRRLLEEAAQDRGSARARLLAAAELFVTGRTPDLSPPEERLPRLPLLPGTSFATERFWPDVDAGPPRVDGAASSPTSAPLRPAEMAPPAASASASDVLRARIASVLRLPAGRIPLDQPLSSLGLDSILGLELRLVMARDLQVEVSVAQLLGRATVTSLAAELGPLPAAPSGTAEGNLPPFRPEPEHEGRPFPLTDLQKAYWVGRSPGLPLGGNGCHLYWEIEAAGWDIARLERAWQRLTEAHAMLRAVVRCDGSQQILPEVPPYRLEVHDWTALSPEQARGRLEAVRETMSHEVFDPGSWPLFRLVVSREPTRMRLHFSIDLLIADARSIFRLLAEWGRLYEDPAATSSRPEISFRDYVLHLQALPATRAYRQAEAYWEQRLDALPPGPEMPLAVSLQSLGRPRYQRWSAVVPRATWAALQEHGHRVGLSPVQVVLAAFADVVGRWSRRPRFTLNITVSHRLPVHADVDQVIGDFTSTLLLAVDHEQPGSFGARAQALAQQLARDLDHCLVTGVEVLRRLARRAGEDAAGRTMIPVVFTSMLGHAGAGGKVTRLGKRSAGVSQTPQVWLDFQVHEDEGALCLDWDAAVDLFPPGLIEAMFSAFQGLLAALAVEDRAWSAPGWELLPEAQLATRRAGNATEAPLPEGCLHEPFLRRARLEPGRSAVIAPDRTLTYGELLARALDLSRAIYAREHRPLVAVVLESGWQQVVATLAVLLAGGAYMPIDPGVPQDRLCHLLERGEVKLALSRSSLGLAWPAGVEVMEVPEGPAPALDLMASPPGRPRSSDLAYVIFTSGSTGQPKGVMIEHRAAQNTIADINERFAISPEDRLLGLSSLSFDLSVYDLFGTLAVGAALVLPSPASARDPEHLASLIHAHRVTVWNSVPMYLQLLLTASEAATAERLSSLRLVMLSGDWIPVSLPGALRARNPRAKLISLGGATEGSIWSILYPVEQVEPTWTSIPYGFPMANQRFYVVDDQLRNRPDWVPGELCIGGVGVASGYWREPARTAERFILHPATGERLYRTGDIGRYHPDGVIEFLGREDGQVKIGGFRVELGEVEAALARQPEVKECAVSVRGEAGAQRKLVAAWVGRDGAAMSSPELRARLGKVLPPYMIPSLLVRLEALPLNATGKVDRRAIAALSAEAPAPRAPARAEAEPARLLEAGPTGGLLDDPQILRDPAARKAFTASRRGAPAVAGAARVALPSSSGGEVATLGFERRTSRIFHAAPLPLETLADLLGCLGARQEGAELRFRYPSAGSTYAVRGYLAVGAGRVEGLEANLYVYDPLEHAVRVVQPGGGVSIDLHFPVNRAAAREAAFTLLLVADLGAIRPLYGSISRDLTLVEAGYMGQLLMMAGARLTLGLCPLGGLDFSELRQALGLSEDHILVHAFVGGTPREATAVAAPREASAVSAGAGVANGAEDALRQLWLQVLGVNVLDEHQNLFEAGGDSFAVVVLNRRINEELGLPCTVTDIFARPTLHRLRSFLLGTSPEPAPVADEGRRARAGRRQVFRAGVT